MPKVRLSHLEPIRKYVVAAGGDSEGDLTLAEALAQYPDLRETLKADSPTMDDSDAPIDLSNTIETMDNASNKWWSADSDEFQAQIAARSV